MSTDIIKNKITKDLSKYTEINMSSNHIIESDSCNCDECYETNPEEYFDIEDYINGNANTESTKKLSRNQRRLIQRKITPKPKNKTKKVGRR